MRSPNDHRVSLIVRRDGNFIGSATFGMRSHFLSYALPDDDASRRSLAQLVDALITIDAMDALSRHQAA
ncbi:hypothetical protein ACOI1H_13550 [Loktanella sp. DJP18]|uniref:hypothetical protein n=1 Tax=Loktanella sp. DJP18 TaxID=3409788 RepID=UPI003BB6832E